MDKNISAIMQRIDKMQNEIDFLWVFVFVTFSMATYVFFTCKDN